LEKRDLLSIIISSLKEKGKVTGKKWEEVNTLLDLYSAGELEKKELITVLTIILESEGINLFDVIKN
jgi:hypothetical protein